MSGQDQKPCPSGRGVVKRYWLFTGEEFYPEGGMLDFAASYDTLDDAKRAGYSTFTISNMQGKELRSDSWFHVFDAEIQEVVFHAEHQESKFGDSSERHVLNHKRLKTNFNTTNVQALTARVYDPYETDPA